jgi:hypothetical protein
MPDDNPHARLRELPQFNSFGVRTFGNNLLTVRVDLDRWAARRRTRSGLASR